MLVDGINEMSPSRVYYSFPNICGRVVIHNSFKFVLRGGSFLLCFCGQWVPKVLWGLRRFLFVCFMFKRDSHTQKS